MIQVLVVEDSPVIREFLIQVLNSDPAIHVVETAADGEEALQAVAKKKPDLITMDIHMPKMNGLEATRRIMETCTTPIVIVSGSSSVREVQRLSTPWRRARLRSSSGPEELTIRSMKRRRKNSCKP